MSENRKEEQFQIELTEEIAQGIYSNLAIISHSSSEFILDFVQVMPGVQKAGVKSRLIMPPEHVKRLFYALKENLNNYENKFGEINLPEMNLPKFPTSGKGDA